MSQPRPAHSSSAAETPSQGLMDRLVDRICGPERNAWRPEKSQTGLGDTLEALAIAVAAAVLLKYFAIEAYQIPTSSMQPTLMGSAEAGVYDRILVDKTAYLFRDPQRWDVGVFRYPLQKNQSYVKRIVGVPGDRLRLRSGNILVVDQDGQATDLLFKPDRIQSGLWREVYPRRREIREELSMSIGKDALDGWWKGRGGDWKADGDRLTAKIRNRGQLTYEGRDNGLVNYVWDGYPAEIAGMIRSENGDGALVTVSDARLGATFTAPGGADGVHLELLARRPDGSTRSYRAECEQGQMVFHVRDEAGEWSSSPVPCEVLANSPVELRFAMRDGRLRFWRDGDLIAENNLMTATQDGRLLLLDDLPVPPGSRSSITPRMHLMGQGDWQVTEPRLERDLHYTWRGTNHEETTVVEVPEGHYWMLGDNTLQSIDSRGWTAITVAVDEDGNALDPKAHPDLPTLTGNKRPMALEQKVDADENPVPLPDRSAMVMIDEWGERHRLLTRIGPDYAVQSPDEGRRVELVPLVGDDPGPWRPPESTAAFVPAEHFQGRALMVFWPWWSEMRVGFVR